MIGEIAPDFDIPCVNSDGTVARTSRDAYRGRWLALVFYPRDFSFVCPTELSAISASIGEFTSRSCDVIGISVDTLESHIEWRRLSICDGGIGAIRFPLASDLDGSTAKAFGAWLEQDKLCTRALFLIDPTGVVQYSVLHNLAVGRNVEEILRVLDALQSGGICPASWQNSDGTIDMRRALRTGRVLGHFRLQEQLGAGAFGRVFAARDLQLERTVALKILVESESRERFLAEARAVAQINHPNVCGIYSVEVHDGLAMIAMPLIAGPALDELPSTLGERERIELASGIAEGIAAAHERNIVHGDLKPANILLDAEGIPQIVDFGLAKIHRPTRIGVDEKVSTSANEVQTVPAEDVTNLHDTVSWEGELSSSGKLKGSSLSGTPAYMSPEQLAGETATPASDVYSFGLILRDLMCGPREYRTLADIVLERLSDIRVELSERQARSPQAELVEQLLRKDASLRPSIATVAEALAGWL